MTGHCIVDSARSGDSDDAENSRPVTDRDVKIVGGPGRDKILLATTTFGDWETSTGAADSDPIPVDRLSRSVFYCVSFIE